MNQKQEWPDYTPLKQIVEDSDGMLTLDFSTRIGARPYITYEDGKWSGVSVGPFGQTDGGETVITTKELDVDESEVVEMLDGARIVQLRPTRETPIKEYEFYGTNASLPLALVVMGGALLVLGGMVWEGLVVVESVFDAIEAAIRLLADGIRELTESVPAPE